MTLTPIERRSGISREEFIESYLKPKKPVVLTDLIKSWPAEQKWNFDYLKSSYGHLDVPIVGPGFNDPGPNYMKSTESMKFGDYLDMIQAGPTKKRIFLWNIFDQAPKLLEDVRQHTICDGWVDKYPFMFFGGQGAVTPMHYDIDCSHVFHTHFATTKYIILFGPDQSKLLYQHPFTVQSRVNPVDPDFEKFPAARYAQGVDTTLHHGETLFIPSLWWHYIRYEQGGFSISLRSVDNIFTQARGLMNISRHFVVDKGMNALLGENWGHWKERTAIRRAEEGIPA